jgi:hypothetical protein
MVFEASTSFLNPLCTATVSLPGFPVLSHLQWPAGEGPAEWLGERSCPFSASGVRDGARLGLAHLF